MGKFIERILFFVISPIAFIIGFIQSLLNSDCSSAQTVGCVIGSWLVPIGYALVPIAIGLINRGRRIKKRKAKEEAIDRDHYNIIL
jgi:hypothetical protein